MTRALVFACAAALALGCGAPSTARTPETAAALTVHGVEWNPTHGAIGRVRTVADDGADVVVFGDAAATVLTHGAIVAEDRAARDWKAAATLPAPDGSGQWIVGVDGAGKLWRLRGRRAFEPAGDRYAVGGSKVAWLASLGTRGVAFGLDRGLVIADDGDAATYPWGALLQGLAGGGSTVAAMSQHGMTTIDVPTKRSRGYDLDGARYVAVDETGRAYVATEKAIYAADEAGVLRLRYVAHDPIHGLVAAGGRVWFADGVEVGLVERVGVSRSRGASVASDARLVGSASGDVWAIDGKGALARLSATASFAWTDTVGPVFARVCSGCHERGGSSGVTLAASADWDRERDRIKERVLVTGDMPPRGTAWSDGDREAVRRWAEGHP